MRAYLLQVAIFSLTYAIWAIFLLSAWRALGLERAVLMGIAGLLTFQSLKHAGVPT